MNSLDNPLPEPKPEDYLRVHPAYDDFCKLQFPPISIPPVMLSILRILFLEHTLAQIPETSAKKAKDGWIRNKYLMSELRQSTAPEKAIQRAFGKANVIRPLLRTAALYGGLEYKFEVDSKREGVDKLYRLRIERKDRQAIGKFGDLTVVSRNPSAAQITQTPFYTVTVPNCPPLNGGLLLKHDTRGFSVQIEVAGDWEPKVSGNFDYKAHRAKCWATFIKAKPRISGPIDDRPILCFRNIQEEIGHVSESRSNLILPRLKLTTLQSRMGDYAATSHHRFTLLKGQDFQALARPVADFVKYFSGEHGLEYLHTGMANPLEILVNVLSVDSKLILSRPRRNQSRPHISPVFGAIDSILDATLGSGLLSPELSTMRLASHALGLALHQYPIHWLGLGVAVFAGKCILIGEIVLPFTVDEIVRVLNEGAFSQSHSTFSVHELTPVGIQSAISQRRTTKRPSWQQQLAWALSLHRRRPNLVRLEQSTQTSH